MEFLPKIVVAIVMLALGSQYKCEIIKAAVGNNNDSPVTEIVTTGKIGRLDQLMVLKDYGSPIFMTCLGDLEADQYFMLFFITKGDVNTLLLILKVKSCSEETEEIIRKSVILKSYDSDLNNVEVMVRVRNKGCERYTSVDKRMSPCECRDTQLKHRWTKLSIMESLGILQDISGSIKGRSLSVQTEMQPMTLPPTLLFPTGLGMTEKQEQYDVGLPADTQLRTASRVVGVRWRRGAGTVILQILAIPVCLIAFIVMAAILIPIGLVLGPIFGAGYGLVQAGKATGALLEEVFKDK